MSKDPVPPPGSLRARVAGLLGLPDAEDWSEIRRLLVEAEDEQRRATAELQTLQQSLDAQVRERTRELEETNASLHEQLTGMQQAERVYQSEKEIALVTLRAIADGVVTTDTLARVTYLNPVAERITAWTNVEAIGRPVADIFRRVDETSGLPVSDPVQRVLEQGELSMLPSQSRLLNRNGLSYSIEELATPVRDHDGHLLGVALVFHDVSAARKMANRMSHLAQHDPLTGLPNRMLLHDRLNRAISQARRRRDRVALLFLDVDHFKQINDNLGHLVGDQLLKQLAGRLERSVRASDTVSRQGGDEFVVLLPQVTGPTAPAEVASKILAALSEPFDLDGESLRLSVSIGISLFPDDGDSIDTLTRSADSAMYHAKSQGRSTFQFFTPAVNQHLGERRALQRRLRTALQRGEFTMHYQPTISLRDGRVTGAEALLRWNHPRLGQIGPDQFVVAAEESGLIVPIGRWVLEQVSAQSRHWLSRGLPRLPIAINLSAAQLNGRGFVSEIGPILHQPQGPGLIEFELRESAASEGRARVLNEIHDLGINLAIDDFGSGDASLSMLHKLPIHSIKIDGRLTRGAYADPSQAALLQGLIQVSQKLKVKVVAKGIETPQQLQFLREHGCDEVMGFLFGQPMPAPEFEQIVNRNWAGLLN